MQPVNNFHTHTSRCKHAVGTPSDYAAEARRGGSTALGISCHGPLPDNRWHEFKMEYSELPAYIKDIRAAAEKNPGLRLYAGLECEYIPEFKDYYTNELRAVHGCQYLIGACHFFLHQGEFLCSFYDITSSQTLASFTDYFIETVQSRLFDFIAHPDNFFASWKEWDTEAAAASKAMLSAVKDAGSIVELNCHGFRKPKITDSKGERYQYPLREFWELVASMDLPVIISSDAHSPLTLFDSMDLGFRMAGELGLRVVDFERNLRGRQDAQR